MVSPRYATEIFHNLWKNFNSLTIKKIKPFAVSYIRFRKSFHIRDFLFQVSAERCIELGAIFIFLLSLGNIFAKTQVKQNLLCIHPYCGLYLALSIANDKVLYPVFVFGVNYSQIIHVLLFNIGLGFNISFLAISINELLSGLLLRQHLFCPVLCVV